MDMILHGAWLVRTHDTPAQFALWGESARAESRRRGRKPSLKKAQPHPFGATAAELQQALCALGLGAAAQEGSIAARLPTQGDEPQPSRPFLRESAARASSTLAAWTMPALMFEPLQALTLLIGLPLTDDETPGVSLGADLLYWNEAAGLTLEMLAGQRFAPALIEQDGRLAALWRPALDTGEEQSRLDRFIRGQPPICRAIARDLKQEPPGPRALLTDFLNVLVDAVAREAARPVLKPARRRRGDVLNRPERTSAQAWLEALVSDDPAADLDADFVQAYRAWMRAAQISEGGFRVCFRLDPPEMQTDEDIVVPKARDRGWALRYFLQASDDPSLLVPAEAAWRERGSTLKFLNRKFDQPQERLLAGLGYASRVFAPIEHSLRSARPAACELTTEQAYSFIQEAALLLQSTGFGVLLPGLGARLGVRVKLSPRRQSKSAQGGVAGLSFESVLRFDWQLALGDQPLSQAEFDKLASLKVPLVQIRGQWVELRPEQLQQALDFMRKHAQAGLADGDISLGDPSPGGLSLAEAMRMALAPEAIAGMPITSVEAEGWFGELLQEMRDSARIAPLPPPQTFVGSLRPYQLKGFAWLAFLRRYGLGACLADDMGLGKTIQALALLLHERAEGQARPALLVCPTSAMNNWQREVARFAPSLRVMVHHGTTREKQDLVRLAAEHDIVITSYALLHRDEKHLTAVEWGDVILDEAQNIKNPSTRQAQVARKLKAEQRMALTGTPVENRLSELWSIFQFLNPGYLGSQKDFQTRFARPIERMQDADTSRRLKALVGPFILRRVKTDPSVINDLPEKNEMKVFCPLTKEQATLYEAVVRDSMKRIEESEGIERRGLVLATLMKLKQVCNHPAQFLGDGSALPDRSGKLTRLVEMLEEVRSVKERALIFTQFAEMGELLKTHLQETFGSEVFFLHGGTLVKARARMVERFQDDPHGPFAFVLSIKAGGTALNLTRANHVFHFDRWWNPAVENQATDRAFRIGQTRNVLVHKFLCAGTMEERIDEMIERKQALAASIVGTSEAWITELSTEQLRELFKLQREVMQ